MDQGHAGGPEIQRWALSMLIALLWLAGPELNAADPFDATRPFPVRPPGQKGPVRAILFTPAGELWLGTENEGIWREVEGRWTQFMLRAGATMMKVSIEDVRRELAATDPDDEG